MIAALMGNYAKKMQTIEMPGVRGENFLINVFGIGQSAGLMQRHSLGDDNISSDNSGRWPVA